jgi:hypothetical protein
MAYRWYFIKKQLSKNEMKKRFSEQLGEWVKEKKSRQR